MCVCVQRDYKKIYLERGRGLRTYSLEKLRGTAGTRIGLRERRRPCMLLLAAVQLRTGTSALPLWPHRAYRAI